MARPTHLEMKQYGGDQSLSGGLPSVVNSADKYKQKGNG